MYGHIAKLAEAEKAGVEAAGGTADLFQSVWLRCPSNKHTDTSSRVAEPLPEDVLKKMHAPPKSDKVTVLNDPDQLDGYDAFPFGVPTRFGNMSAQWKTFWDKTGGKWQTGGFWGKYAGLFVSSGTMGGGQESTAIAMMSTLAHHGLIYVPLGSKPVFGTMLDLSEVRGGSPWGAGTFAVSLIVIIPLCFWFLRRSSNQLDGLEFVAYKVCPPPCHTSTDSRTLIYQGRQGERQPSEKEMSVCQEQSKAFYWAVSKVNFS